LTKNAGGIGPKDQLDIVKSSSDGSTMISSDQWITLPVGYNLYDHVGVSLFLFAFRTEYGWWEEGKVVCN